MLLNIGTIVYTVYSVYFKVGGQLVVETSLLYLFKIAQYHVI